jgi:hypothetical protein
MSKKWFTAVRSEGGLGLPSVPTFVASLHTSLLCEAVSQACRRPHQLPRWIQPAIQLFTKSLDGNGIGFDVLYIHRPLHPKHSWTGPWGSLPDFWRSALYTWHHHLLPLMTVNGRKPVQILCQPLWFNTFLLFGSRKLPLKRTTKFFKIFQGLGLVRLMDFIDYYGSFPSIEDLKTTLATVCRRPNVAASALRSKFNMVAIPHWCFRPLPPMESIGALDHWVFDGIPVHKLRTNSIRHFITNHPTPQLPFKQLQCGDDSSGLEILWEPQLRLNQHLLPVYGDVLFRLQHNALGCRYKFKWRTSTPQPTTCIHNCVAEETPKHLFWDCYLAFSLWNLYLLPFEKIFGHRLTWRQVLFLDGLQIAPPHRRRYGSREIFTTLNFVRCIIIRSLWLHRNARLYKNVPTSSLSFLHHQVKTVLLLHTQRYSDVQVNRTSKDTSRSKWRLSNFNDLCLRLYRFKIYPELHR